MSPRSLAGLACLTLFLGTGIAQEKDKSSDQQVKDLIVKYRALPDKDQVGPEGTGIIKQLKAVRGRLSTQSREAIARLEASHNLKQLGLALHNYVEKDSKPRLRWEYKVVPEADILKLGKDDLAAGLNKLGEESWELIGIEKTRFIFKRQK